ncbi:MAG: class I SAM-dependent methyltransferase [Chloroherpetonaceae bacterium]
MSAEHWNARYSETDYIYGTAPNAFLKSSFPILPKGAVLCLGDGEGRNGVFLAEQGYTVTSVDYSEVGLRKAQSLAHSRGVSIQTMLCDLSDFTITPRAWSGIVSIFCHLPPSLRKTVHAQVVRGLKPQGIFLLEAYSPKQLQYGTGGPKQEELLMPLEEVMHELDGLSFEMAHEIERDVVEGKYHTGKAAVIQIIARKNNDEHSLA